MHLKEAVQTLFSVLDDHVMDHPSVRDKRREGNTAVYLIAPAYRDIGELVDKTTLETILSCRTHDIREVKEYSFALSVNELLKILSLEKNALERELGGKLSITLGSFEARGMCVRLEIRAPLLDAELTVIFSSQLA